MAERRARPPVDEFNAEQYKAAAEGHAETLQRLYELGYYVLATYISGVAVESILRAYRCRRNPEFDARHDLRELFKICGVKESLRPQEFIDFNAAVNIVSRRWSNTHRYRSLQALRSFFRDANLHHGIRGDFVKENARRTIEAAKTAVSIGVQQWTKSFKN
jgi:HEPN domain-containing protein